MKDSLKGFYSIVVILIVTFYLINHRADDPFLKKGNRLLSEKKIGKKTVGFIRLQCGDTILFQFVSGYRNAVTLQGLHVGLKKNVAAFAALAQNGEVYFVELLQTVDSSKCIGDAIIKYDEWASSGLAVFGELYPLEDITVKEKGDGIFSRKNLLEALGIVEFIARKNISSSKTNS